MKKPIILVLLILIAFSVDGVAQFTEIKRIQLPDNHLIGSIMGIDVLGNSFLITDMQEQVFLFKDGTDELIPLNPEDCFPGFDFKPIHTFHLADSSIFLINASLPGYRFEADGSCRGSVEDDFIQVPPGKLAVDDDEDRNHFYTLRAFPNQPLRFKSYQETGRLVGESELIKPKFPNFINRFESGGTAVHDGILYYMLPSGAEIYRYDIKRNVSIESIPFEPEYRTAIDVDISADPSQITKDLDEIRDDHYWVSSMFKLSEEYVLIQTHFREGEEYKYGIHFINLKTNEVEEQYAIFEQSFSFARDNKAYRVFDERMEDDNVLNPGIVVYEFTGN
ncbi:hypothetical protein [Gracilimonas sp.]|uniref:hypothetical protein n=1 Tax=Gracilimonas sp. TaxID=1974203 RepID=UPI002870C169|nr:hypothetical protein [Gracilimonas sp.]